MNNNVLVTGGTGVIGVEICKLLIEKKYTVFKLGRKHKDENLNIIQFDILFDDWRILEDYFLNLDYVIHFAASLKIGENSEEINELNKINCEFTEFLLNLSIKYNIKKFVFASTLSFIKKPLPIKINENSEIETILHYSKTKHISEEQIIAHYIKHSLNYAILRVSSPITFNKEQMHNNFLKKWLISASKKQPITLIGSGKRSQDFVAVSDVARATLLSLKSNKNGIYNIASGTSISLNEIASILKTEFHIDLIRIENNQIEDEWDIDISKAKEELKYDPEFDSNKIIKELINIIKK